jgi:6-phosphogluconolactonase
MGADGHVASLFPGHAALEERTRLAVAVEGAGIAPPRVTLTLPALSAADSVVILVSGAAKAKTVHSVLGHGTGPGLPAARVRARGTLVWLLDREAAL